MNNSYIALFAGTTEGRIIAEKIAYGEGYSHISADVYVATEYGKEGLPDTDGVKVFCGRLDDGQMSSLFSNKKYDFVIDATHPYATEVTANIRKACEETGTEYMRVLREDENTPDTSGIAPELKSPDQESLEEKTSQTVFVDSVKEAVEFLKNTEGNILVTTGSKELKKFCEIPDWEERVYARVLSTSEVVSDCAALGFIGRHLIAMEGPFSEEMNIATIRMTDAQWVVTKESGKNGGFEEKKTAAEYTGAGLVIIGRPAEEGVSLDQALERLRQSSTGSDKNGYADHDTGEINSDLNLNRTPGTKTDTAETTGTTNVRKVWLIGIGPGSEDQMSLAAEEILKECDLICGVARNIETFSYLGKPVLKEYTTDKIIPFLNENKQYRNIAVTFSGDTGFYSGAVKLFNELKKIPDTVVEMIPGISSVNYFFAKIGRSWENVKLLSMHGREVDIVKEVSRNREVFLIAGAADAFNKVSAPLIEAGLDKVKIIVGEDLSLPDEKIYTASCADLINKEAKPLTVMYIENVPIKKPILNRIPKQPKGVE